jgi:hypothetical protein
MNSGSKFCLSLVLCIFFISGHVHAQKTSLPDLLIGEWSMKGPVKPKINDTITLTKELLNELEYPRWVFKTPNKLQITHYYDYKNSGRAQIAVSKAGPSEWYYDNSSDLLKILYGTSSQYFKIIANKDKSLKLILVKG